MRYFRDMKPLIKWPGGKSNELPQIRAAFPPAFETYVEPFFGGGALFFDSVPKAAHLNDINRELIQFYRFIQTKNTAFMDALKRILADWQLLSEVTHQLSDPYQTLFAQLAGHHIELGAAQKAMAGFIHSHLAANSQLHFQFLENTSVWNYLLQSLVSKLHRIRQLEKKHQIKFSHEKNEDHLETAVRAAYYTAVRDEFVAASEEEAIAAFFFIREYCYGSMFRFNKNGKFNIPYGGIAYNKKDFASKIDHLFSAEVGMALARATFWDEDFETFIQKIAPKLDQAFAFFDPPYDTEFRDYAQSAFGVAEQKRLARVFNDLPCYGMIVIKETAFIRSLYDSLSNPNIVMTSFEKTYTYNVRGRNDREVNHLLITNYPLDQSSLEPQVLQMSLL